MPFVFSSSVNWSNISSIFRLTEQFEGVCMPEIESPRSKKNFDVSLCQMFEWTISRGLSRFWLHVSRTRFSIYYLKSLSVIKEMVNVQCATIELWMHLGGLLSTQEARVTRGDSRVRLLHFFRAYQPPACIHNSIVARCTLTISSIVTSWERVTDITETIIISMSIGRISVYYMNVRKSLVKFLENSWLYHDKQTGDL